MTDKVGNAIRSDDKKAPQSSFFSGRMRGEEKDRLHS